MALLTYNCEGGTNGSSVETTDTGSGDAFDYSTPTNKPVYSNAFAMHGNLSIRCGDPGDLGAVVWNTKFTDTLEDYGRVYFRQEARDGGSNLYLVLHAVSGGWTRFYIGTDGKVILNDGVSPLASGTVVLSLNTWYRFEYHLKISTTDGCMECRIYEGDSNQLVENVNSGDVNMGSSNAVDVGFGHNQESSTNHIVYLDDIVAGATTWPGPAVPPLRGYQPSSLLSFSPGSAITGAAPQTDSEAFTGMSYRLEVPTAANANRARDLVILQLVEPHNAKAVTLSTIAGIRSLTNKNLSMTELTTVEQAHGASGAQRLWAGWISSGTPSIDLTIAAGSSDGYWRHYIFQGVFDDGLTINEIFENGGSTHAGANGTGTTISDVGVTTNGPGRVALNFVAVGDDVALGDFSGQTGGTWIEAGQEFTSGFGLDGGVGLYHAGMQEAGTINGGTMTIASATWSVIGLALIPKGPIRVLNSPRFERVRRR